MKNPFKVGDKVVRIGFEQDEPMVVGEVDGNFIRGETSCLFNIFTDYKMWKPPEEVIVIRTDGTHTKAYYKRDGKVVSEAKCRRNHADKHNLKALAALALNRVLPNDKNEIVVREKGYYGAVAVTKVFPVSHLPKPHQLTPGMILEFYAGRWKDAPFTSFAYGMHYDDFAEVQKRFSDRGYEVIELHR